MPSSVVFAALVLAWLVVLVPVVARRRQMVPRPAEADLSAKVLPRSAAGPAMKEVPVPDAPQDRRAGSAMSAARTGGATAVADRPGDGTEATVEIDGGLDRELDRELELDAHGGDHHHAVHGSQERVLARGTDDRADEWEYGDDEHLDEPRSYRPGRGGFDPEAAEVAAHARYAFRQRVALGLIAVAALSALAALVVTPALWSLHVLTDLVLIGYLVFLRRQTRIEEEVRARRAARLSGERRAIEARRERQAAHDDLMTAHHRDAEQWGRPGDEDVEYDAVDVTEDGAEYDDGPGDEVDADGEVPAPRWAAPRTPAPAVPDGMELVDDSDDDPAFHELDGRDGLPSYRRAAAGA